MRHFLMVLVVVIFLTVVTKGDHLMAGSSYDYAQKLTEYLQRYNPNWSLNQTIEMLNQAQLSGTYTEAMLTDKGMVRIQIMGDTILVGGKDITGNLGSKITHGDYSPIIENVKDSNIAIGSGNIVGSNYQGLFNALNDFKQNVSMDEKLPTTDRLEVTADIDTIQSQLKKEKPSINIIKEAWEGIKKILKVYDYGKTIFEISKLLMALFGI